jgi:hypothetical protein
VGAQLTAVAIVFGVLMVLLFGKLSNQEAVRRVKDEIAAAILEVYLFRRDIRLSLRAQGSLFKSGVRYLFLALGPVFILLIPFAVLLGHFNLRLGNKPLDVGSQAVLTVRVAPNVELDSVALNFANAVQVPGNQAPDIMLAAGPVRVQRDRELLWRLSPQQAGRFELSVSTGATRATENVVAGADDGGPVGIFYSTEDWLLQLVYPDGSREARPSSGPIRFISLDFPQHAYSLFGLELSWMSAFLIVSLLAGYAGSKVFGISV